MKRMLIPARFAAHSLRLRFLLAILFWVALGIGGINDAVGGAAAGLFLDVVVRGMPPSPPVMIFLPSGGI